MKKIRIGGYTAIVSDNFEHTVVVGHIKNDYNDKVPYTQDSRLNYADRVFAGCHDWENDPH